MARPRMSSNDTYASCACRKPAKSRSRWIEMDSTRPRRQRYTCKNGEVEAADAGPCFSGPRRPLRRGKPGQESPDSRGQALRLMREIGGGASDLLGDATRMLGGGRHARYRFEHLARPDRGALGVSVDR